ncbi:MAG: hypothetical protein ABW360_03905 [Phenylobacterium sp.]
MATLLLVLLVIYAWWAKDSGLGRSTRRLTATGLRWLASIRPLTLWCFVAVVAGSAGLIAYGQFEGLILAGLAAPETFALFLAIDVGTAAEVAVLAWLAVGRGHLRVAWRRLKSVQSAVAPWTRARPRDRRSRAGRGTAKPANDDEPAGGLATALALAA